MKRVKRKSLIGKKRKTRLLRILTQSLTFVLTFALVPVFVPNTKPAAAANAYAQRPFPQAQSNSPANGYAVTRVMPSDRTQQQMNQDVADQFNRLISQFDVENGTERTNDPDKFLMVLRLRGGTGTIDPYGVTACEAQGYGMLMLSYMAGAEDMMVPSNPTNLSSARVPLKQRLKDNLPAGLRTAYGNRDVTIKDYYDACFRTMQRFPTNVATSHGSYLMAWHIVADNEARTGAWRRTNNGPSIATDGALDMTYSLLIADKQWGGPPHGRTIDANGTAAGQTASDSFYLYWGKGAIHQLRMTAINRDYPSASNGLFNAMIGNWPGGQNRRITRPSDFMLTHWTAFAEVGTATGRTEWNKVLSQTYTAIDQASHPTTKLLADFLWYGADNRWKTHTASPTDGITHWNENTTNDSKYGWNACRVPWRLGLDALWKGEASPVYVSTRTMNEQTRSRTGTNFGSIRGGDLGNPNDNGFSGNAFQGPYLVTASVYGPQNWMTNGWTWARNYNSAPNSYGCYITLLSMIAASGNWWNPTVGGAPITPPPTPTPMPTPTPAPPSIALNKPAMASSVEISNTASFPANNGNDGNYDSRWAAGNPGPQNCDEWWMVDLQQEYNLTGFNIHWEEAASDRYTIKASVINPGANPDPNANIWTTVYTKNSGEQGEGIASGNLTNAKGRWVMIHCTRRVFFWQTTYYGPSFFEFNLYGTPVPVDANRGDVNGDGVINAADATMLRRYLQAADKAAFEQANPGFNALNADVNGDGVINFEDVTALRKFIASNP